jgi:cytochrome P450
MPFLKYCLAEGLRKYPQPPVLLRRALTDNELPLGRADRKTFIPRGADLFISTWNIHMSPDLWEEPETYDPSRWERPVEGHGDWAGYDPEKAAFPNELASDYAYIPFGGGSRRCMGDQFAQLESSIILAGILRRFDFEFAGEPPRQPEEGDLPGNSDVGMRTGATIHTESGLWLVPKRRVPSRIPVPTPTTNHVPT